MIEPKRKTVEEILGTTRYKFSIPEYQRNYDWGAGEIEELLNDLSDISIDNNDSLFIGSFIFDISSDSNYKIVDGQQRLTTISLIFIALREQAKKINELNFAAEIQKYIANSSSIRKNHTVKLDVSENIKKIYQHISHQEWDGSFPDTIDGCAVKRQINKVKPIYTHISNAISDFNNDRLSEFTKSLLDTYAIVINVEKTEDVFSIFERTNARGLDLNIGDLMKNYIFAHGSERFEEKWLEIINNANGSLQRMLKYFWVSRRGYVQQSKLYRNLKELVRELNIENDKDGIDVFVDDLYEFSRYYKVAQSQDVNDVQAWLSEIELNDLSKNESYYPQINRVFQALKLFRVTQAYPLIYAIFKFYIHSKKTTKKRDQLIKVLKRIENYHFVNNVISGHIGNEVEKFYAESAKNFFTLGSGFIEHTNTFLKELSEKRAYEDEFISNFIESVTYSSKNIALINYVYDRINNYGVKGGQYFEIFSPQKDLHTRNYNIEHLLAQNKKNEDYSDSEKEIFDKIGNLLILNRHSNSRLQDKDGIEKIDIIKSDKKHIANLRYFDEFIKKYENDLKDWNLESIKKRSKEIATMSYNEIWFY